MTQKILLTLFLICLVVSVSTAQTNDAKSKFSFIEDENGIELSDNGNPVLFYQKKTKSLENGGYPSNNYIHPLYNLNNEVLTEDFPEDHPYHHGIFWAWHYILHKDTVISSSWSSRNFKTVINDVKTEICEDNAVLLINASWTSPVFQNGTPYLEENTTVTINGIKDGVRILDFDIRFKALVDDLKIGGANNEKGYGGFCLRIAMPDDLIFTAESGNITPQKTQIDAGQWMDFSATFGEDNGVSGVTLIYNEDYPGCKQNWILRQRRSMQNIAFPGRTPVELTKDEELIMKYRLVIHNDNIEKYDVENWVKNFK